MTLPTRVSQHPLDYAQRDFDTLLNRLFNGGQANVFATCAVDVREDTDHIYVEAELPGFKKEEVDITLENSTLTISAEHKTQTRDEKESEYLLNERLWSRFLRSFTLPPTVDEKSVQANLIDGVLKITLNKREETKPRKIQVG